MKKKNLLGIILFTLWAFAGIAQADTTIYDKNYNVQGHKKESGGTVSVYDKNWNRTGYEKGDKIYDKNWNVKGYKKSEGHNKDHGSSERSRKK